MFTSKPPFQSSTTDEIYRRARNRDYEWPNTDGTNKYISQEAKEIVATMLVEADQRPEPDIIVQHDFFISGYVPLQTEIIAKLRDCPPESDAFYEVDQSPGLIARNMRHHQQLCQDCEVGPWNNTQKVYTSTWREVALEEKAGLTPIIPLIEGIVYRPFEDVNREQALDQVSLLPPQQPKVKKEDSSMSATQTSQVPPRGLLREPPQSFAAQQRAQGRSKPVSLARSQTLADMGSLPSASGTMRPRVKRELVRSSTEDNILAQPAESAPQPVKLPSRTLASASRHHPSESRKAEIEKPRERVAAVAPPSAPAPVEAGLETLFSPSEPQHSVPDTKPDLVLDRLRRLQSELERALNARTMAIVSKATAKTPPAPHIVVKWVDYSNKFGLGYILNDGSVGCVLKSLPGKARGGKVVRLPPSCIVVRDAENHCQRRHDPGYPDRHQIVPMTQPIQFFENNGEAGLSTVHVHPTQFKIGVNPDGTPGKVPVGKDIYDYRKREHLILWKKFANYMMAYGRDQEAPTDDTGHIQIPTSSDSTLAPCDVVTFYQRIGDVGCWVFADGHLQFNFPDHTKIVLDSTATWCHFWHLPQEAAVKLAQTGELDETALDERAVLSYPLQTLLNFASKPAIRPTRNAQSSQTRKRPEISPMLQGIPAANDFRRKVDFIKNIIKEWVGNDGLGNSNMSREKRMMWTGYRETVIAGPSKHVWVTIGARWGDERFSAIVDPKNPHELGEDVEERKKADAS